MRLTFLLMLSMLRVDTVLAQTPSFLLQWGGSGSDPGQFNSPVSVALDADQNVYIADRHNHRIQKFDINGQFLAQWGTQGDGDGQFQRPIGVALDSADNVYVICANRNDVQTFTSSGIFIRRWNGGGSAIDIDSNGNVYVGAAFTLRKYQNDGTLLTSWGEYGTNDGQFSEIQGVAIDDSDNIYVSDRYNGSLQKFDADGEFLGRWVEPEAEFIGIDVGEDGRIHLVDYGHSQIITYAGDGGPVMRWGVQGIGPGEFTSPWDVAAAPNGIVFVVEDDRVQKFTLNSTPTTALSWGKLKSRY